MQEGGEGAVNLPPPSVCSVRKHLQYLSENTCKICQKIQAIFKKNTCNICQKIPARFVQKSYNICQTISTIFVRQYLSENTCKNCPKKYVYNICQKIPAVFVIKQLKHARRILKQRFLRHKIEDGPRLVVKRTKSKIGFRRSQYLRSQKKRELPEDCRSLLLAKASNFCPIGLAQIDHDSFSQLIHPPPDQSLTNVHRAQLMALPMC